ncbi:S1C family serine protease [Fervidicella metallireducens]|uniref:S1C family serine protease n=1 Tax=Fervidicella metallireducens TaxID=655338 RepID=UPI000AF79231|nr:trypsin-like peptidase domain-containing protein [Fervidicella metallireducens]
MEFGDFRGKKPSIFGYIAASLFGAVIGGLLLLMFGPAVLFDKFKQPSYQEPIKTSPERVVERVVTSDVSDAAEKVIPTVVGIATTKIERGLFDYGKKVQGVGSGIIIDEDGYILTNNHVAGMNAKYIAVSLYDGRDVEGRTVWADPVLDLAIVKIEADNLKSAQLADSSLVKIGQQAIAVGNPLGLKFQRTVTSGIVSAVNRTISLDTDIFMEDLIQTDASINPGNSGGPLVNIKGEVIGVNTVKVSTAEGIGFAVPINIIKPVLRSIKSTGSFVTPVMGIKGFDKELAGYFNYKIKEGIYIYESVVNGRHIKQE